MKVVIQKYDLLENKKRPLIFSIRQAFIQNTWGSLFSVNHIWKDIFPSFYWIKNCSCSRGTKLHSLVCVNNILFLKNSRACYFRRKNEIKFIVCRGVLQQTILQQSSGYRKTGMCARTMSRKKKFWSLLRRREHFRKKNHFPPHHRLDFLCRAQLLLRVFREIEDVLRFFQISDVFA